MTKLAAAVNTYIKDDNLYSNKLSVDKKPIIR